MMARYYWLSEPKKEDTRLLGTSYTQHVSNNIVMMTGRSRLTNRVDKQHNEEIIALGHHENEYGDDILTYCSSKEFE